MKMMERMKKKKLGNKGFSLVEMIIVIAIMAILIGIVGTQVVPYLQEAREAKDMAIVDSFATSAVSCYTFNPEMLAETEAAGGCIWIDVFATDGSGEGSTVNYISPTTSKDLDSTAKRDDWRTAFAKLTGYKCDQTTGRSNLRSAMSSSDGKVINGIMIAYNFGTSESGARYGVKVPAGSVIAYAYKGNNGATKVLKVATAPIGSHN